MAEKEVVATNSPDDLFSDEALGLSDVPEEKEVTDGEQSSPTSTGEGEVKEEKPTFGGLPFKSQDEFIRSHKSLQESYRQSREEIYRLKEMIQQFKPLLEQVQKGQVQPQPEVDIPTFLEDFLKTGPKAIEQVAGKTLEDRWKKFEQEHFSGLRQEVQKLRDERQIDRFLADHPEVKDEDEDALIDIVRATPWIRKMDASLYEKLEAAYDRLTRKEPTRFSSRSGKESQTLTSMKQAASSVGTKAGTRQRAAKDEFDEVLERDNQSRALWR